MSLPKAMKGPRSGRWRFLDAFPAPTPEEQHRLTLDCAAARTLYRVAILRSPRLPPPVLEQTERLKLRIASPLAVDQLIPTALAMWNDDQDGVVCDLGLDWLKDQPDLDEVAVRASRARTRWLSARARIIEANMRLGASIVRKRFLYTAMSPDDLLQEAVFGLARAADRFDPNYGVKFSTYASWWIRHATQRAVHNTMRLVRLPAHVCESLSRYSVALRELGSNASEAALAQHTGLPRDKLKQVAHLYHTQGMGPVSLDEPVPGLDSPLPRLEQMVDDQDFEAEISQEQQDAMVRSMILHLPDRTRVILKQHYGLDDDETRTLAQIGKRLSLSRERVRQIEKSALRTLAKYVDPALCPISRT